MYAAAFMSGVRPCSSASLTSRPCFTASRIAMIPVPGLVGPPCHRSAVSQSPPTRLAGMLVAAAVVVARGGGADERERNRETCRGGSTGHARIMCSCYTILCTGSGAISELWRPRTAGEQFLSAWRPSTPIRESFRVCESRMQISCEVRLRNLERRARCANATSGAITYIYSPPPAEAPNGPNVWCLSSGPERGASALNAQGAPRSRGGHCPHSCCRPRTQACARTASPRPSTSDRCERWTRMACRTTPSAHSSTSWADPTWWPS